ncbi:hypothetical protein FRX31_021339 [Thalictrum thalictroides]|uniref:Uncharacterized protein n=1 Tax=Thalictrum thalictroides TaxID=46969 RepID=A0A7J6VW45_THATH|nr:hypothetical protein FRX31_021339 [Thalictrum thalictroides]
MGVVFGEEYKPRETSFLQTSSIRPITTRFWHDCWIGETPFVRRFHLLYRYSSMKDGSVRDHYSETNGWELHLRRSLFRENERSQLDLLMGLFVDYALNDEEDEWEWVKEKQKGENVVIVYCSFNF